MTKPFPITMDNLEAERERARLEAEARAAKAQAELEATTDSAEAVIAAEAAEVAQADLADAEQMELQTQVLHDGTDAIPKQAGVSVKTVWKWREADISLIPRKFLTCKVNKALINAMVKATEGATNIPGIKVYQESAVRTVRKRSGTQ